MISKIDKSTSTFDVMTKEVLITQNRIHVDKTTNKIACDHQNQFLRSLNNKTIRVLCLLTIDQCVKYFSFPGNPICSNKICQICANN